MRTITISTILGNSFVSQGKTIVVDGKRMLSLRNLCASLSRGMNAEATYWLALFTACLPAGLSRQSHSWEPSMCRISQPAHAGRHERRSWRDVGVGVVTRSASADAS